MSDAGTILDAGVQLLDAGPAIPDAVVRPTGVGPGFFNLDNMLRAQNVVVVVASWSVTELISRAGRGLTFVRERLLPVLPLIFCELLVFATASWQPEATHGERALLGALLGTVTVWGHQAAKRAGLHDLLPFMRDKATDDKPGT